MTTSEVALIVGAGRGLSAAFARLCAAQGMQVALAARDSSKLDALATEAVEANLGVPDVVLYNPSYRIRGPLVELDAEGVKRGLMISAYGGFLVGQAAARLMLERGSGSILFTGASASVKGYPQSAPFAMGKFALRGLAQSMARELAPKNIHVAHFVIDGGILAGEETGEDAQLHPEAIAETYLHVHRQHRSAWTWEVELRPWVERF